MRILFAISMLAFLALLWATIAIAQHVRRSRRRRRRSLEAAGPPPGSAGSLGLTGMPPLNPAHVVTFVDPEVAAATPARGNGFFRSRFQSAPPPPATPARVAGVGAPWPDVKPLAAAPPLAFPDGPPVAPPNPQYAREPQPPPPAPVPAPHGPRYDAAREPVPLAGPFSKLPGWPLPDSPFPQSSDLAAMPLATPSRPSKNPFAALFSSRGRADLAYFNKDMGDLSDPEPPRRGSRELKAFKDPK